LHWRFWASCDTHVAAECNSRSQNDGKIKKNTTTGKIEMSCWGWVMASITVVQMCKHYHAHSHAVHRPQRSAACTGAASKGPRPVCTLGVKSHYQPATLPWTTHAHTHTHTQLTTHPTICNDVHMQVKDCVSTAWRVLSRPVSQELTPVHTHSCAPDRFCVWAWRIRNVKGRTTCILHCGHQVSAANTGGLCPPPSHIHHHQQTKRSS
jgi:hypothetical protein